MENVNDDTERHYTRGGTWATSLSMTDADLGI